MTANITIIGNVGKAPEKRNAGSQELASFSVATTRKVKQDKVTTWFNCSVWGKQSDIIMQYVSKGDKIAVFGELSTREHEGKTYLEVNVRDFHLIGGGGEKSEAQPAKTSGVPIEEDFVPF